MSKRPRTFGRMPGAIRSESSSPDFAGALTTVVVAISPPWTALCEHMYRAGPPLSRGWDVTQICDGLVDFGRRHALWWPIFDGHRKAAPTVFHPQSRCRPVARDLPGLGGGGRPRGALLPGRDRVSPPWQRRAPHRAHALGRRAAGGRRPDVAGLPRPPDPAGGGGACRPRI